MLCGCRLAVNSKSTCATHVPYTRNSVLALAVALGAFGAHGLKTRLKDLPEPQANYYQDVWKTASNYHLVHSAAVAFST